MARVTVDIGPPLGAWRRISSSSSAMAFSATGFLLVFLTRPISNDKPRRLRVGSVRSATKPGAGSTLMMAGGPSRGCSSLHNLARAVTKCVGFLVVDDRRCGKGCCCFANDYDSLFTPLKDICGK